MSFDLVFDIILIAQMLLFKLGSVRRIGLRFAIERLKKLTEELLKSYASVDILNLILELTMHF